MTTNEAMVLSIEADVAPNTLRVSLQWQGDHDVSDFDLQLFGKVLRIQDETEHTGWARLLNVDSMRGSHIHYLGGRSMNQGVR